MTPTPIYDAIAVLRRAVTAALKARTALPVAWQQAPQGIPMPFVIWQSQDAGGRSERRVGNLGWSGLVTVRALATDQLSAEQLFATVAPGMASMSAPGFVISAAWERPVVIPPLDNTWQSGGLWRVSIDRL